MPTITIRNLSDAAHRGLKARATQNVRSVAAETRHIIETAVFPETRLKLGSAIAEISRRHGMTDQDIEALDLTRTEETSLTSIDHSTSPRRTRRSCL